MGNASPLKLIAVFLVIVIVAIGGAVAVGSTGGESTPDGEQIDGQSPEQFQPENLDQEFDPEEGEIDIDTDAEGKRILVDTGHSNQISEGEIEPIVESVFESGHRIDFGVSDDAQSDGAQSDSDTNSYGETLSNYDGVLIVQPVSEFSKSERKALGNYTDAGGRVVVLGEPTQIQASLGLFGIPSAVSFGADNLTQSYGFQVGAEMLYNTDPEQNDNNFKSIYAAPNAPGSLTEGVDRITFDRGGYVVVDETRQSADDITTLYTAAEGTKTLETRREGEYPVAVRNDNLVFVADSTFVQPSEVYDADNEVFVSNLFEFLASGDLNEDFPSEQPSPPSPPEPPEEPTPAGTETPTPEGTPTPATTAGS